MNQSLGMNSNFKKVILPLILVGTCLSAHSAVITGVNATASTSYGHVLINQANLVNNTGMSVPNDVTASHAQFGTSANGWHSSGGTVDNEFVTFDLGQIYDLDKIYIWQMNQGSNLGRGVRQFDLLVSSNGTDYAVASSNLELAQGTETATTFAQSFSLNQTGIRYVRLEIDSAWSGSATEYVGLSEVKFTSVPEPATVLLGGLGILGLLRRRRA